MTCSLRDAVPTSRSYFTFVNLVKLQRKNNFDSEWKSLSIVMLESTLRSSDNASNNSHYHFEEAEYTVNVSK